MFKDNRDFYPTPTNLIEKLMHKVKKKYSIQKILEPGAGMGHIVNYLIDEGGFSRREISVLEHDPRLFKMLLGDDRIRVVGKDFLTYQDDCYYDLIIANFPFSDGVHHAIKAINMMVSGQVAFILDAATIKRALRQEESSKQSNYEYELGKLLETYDADVEYVTGAFESAERKTSVEVALVHLEVFHDARTTILEGMIEEDSVEAEVELEIENDLVSNNKTDQLVQNFNRDKVIAIDFIKAYYSKLHRLGGVINLEVVGSKGMGSSSDTLTDTLKRDISEASDNLKKKYWIKALDLREVKDKLTKLERQTLSLHFDHFCSMPFTQENISIFIENIMSEYPAMIERASDYIFDKLTGYSNKEYYPEGVKNIYLFDGWKTNKAHRVNSKVIIPRFAYQEKHSKDLSLYRDSLDFIEDIERVMAFYCVNRPPQNCSEKIRKAIKDGETREIDTSLFTIAIYKKGTCHVTFKNLEALRWFNIEVGKRRGFLPDGYGERDFPKRGERESKIVRSFEEKSCLYKTTKSVREIVGGQILISA